MSHSTHSESIERHHRRYWRQVNPAAMAWWPWGWLLLLPLLLLFFYGATSIASHMQAEVTAEVSAALAAANIETTEVMADGQHVSVSAIGLEQDRAKIAAVARSSACDTWYGRLVCPVEVELELSEPELTVAQTSEPPQPSSRYHNVIMSSSREGVVLSGEVPSQEAKQQLISMAKQNFPKVIDRLTITEALATDPFPLAMERGLATLVAMKDGTMRWFQGQLSGQGVVDADQEALIRKTFSASDDQPPLGDLSLYVIAKPAPIAVPESTAIEEAIDRCNEEFSALLSRSTINFVTASAEINSNSVGLLQQLAKLASDCPGQLIIEGHTDSTGSESFNQQLSLARAEAVLRAMVNLGFPEQRISAAGFGSSRPIADNQTRSGRAKNRRIVIRSSN